jgi:uncharacterized membrane protein YwaF
MTLQWYHYSSVLIIIVVLWAFKNKSQSERYRFLYVLSIINFIAYFWNWLNFVWRSDHVLTLLPLQLCDIAVFLIPIGLIFKKQAVVDFVFYVCALGALGAIIFVGSDYEDTYSWMTISFYIFHFTIFLIPLLMSAWGFYTMKPTVKKAIMLTMVMLGSGAFMHGLNLYLNNVVHVPANYYFTIKDLGAPINPALAYFASIIPYDYFYLFFAFPILYAYMALVGLILKIKNSRVQNGSLLKSEQ